MFLQTSGSNSVNAPSCPCHGALSCRVILEAQLQKVNRNLPLPHTLFKMCCSASLGHRNHFSGVTWSLSSSAEPLKKHLRVFFPFSVFFSFSFSSQLDFGENTSNEPHRTLMLLAVHDKIVLLLLTGVVSSL